MQRLQWIRSRQGCEDRFHLAGVESRNGSGGCIDCQPYQSTNEEVAEDPWVAARFQHGDLGRIPFQVDLHLVLLAPAQQDIRWRHSSRLAVYQDSRPLRFAVDMYWLIMAAADDGGASRQASRGGHGDRQGNTAADGL